MTFVRRLEYTMRPTGFWSDLPKDTLRVSFTGGPGLSVAIIPPLPSERHRYRDVKAFFSSLMTPPPIYLDANAPMQHLLVLRQCNLIAGRTRRGAGNIFLVSPDSKVPQRLIDDLAKSQVLTFRVPGLPTDEALLMFQGSGDALVYNGVAITPDDRQVVDGPYAAKINDDGSVDAIVLGNRAESLGNAGDYISNFKVI